MKTFLPTVEAFCVLSALRRAYRPNKSSGSYTHIRSHPAMRFQKRQRLLAVVCAVSALVFLCVVTSEAQDLKIGFVDLQKFASKSVKPQAMQKKLMDIISGTPVAISKKELASLQERFQKQGPMLNEETRNQLLKEIGIKVMEIKKLAEEGSKERASSEEPDAGWILQRDLVKTIIRIRRRKGLAMVFDQGAVLSADNALNITVKWPNPMTRNRPLTPKPLPRHLGPKRLLNQVPTIRPYFPKPPSAFDLSWHVEPRPIRRLDGPQRPQAAHGPVL